VTRPIYLPLNLNLDSIITEKPPNFKPFNKDHLKFILQFPGYYRAKNRDRFEDGYVPINAKTLKHYVGNYQDYLRYATDIINVFDRTPRYIAGETSWKYRINPSFGADLREDLITNQLLINKIISLPRKSEKSIKARHKYPFLIKNILSNKLEYDVLSALEYINIHYKSNPDKFNTCLQSIKAIEQKDWHYSIGAEGHRLYTNLTNLKKELRPFFRYDGRKLVEVDIKCSQPYMSLALLNPEIWKYPRTSSVFAIMNINEKIYREVRSMDEGKNKVNIMVQQTAEILNSIDNQDIELYVTLLTQEGMDYYDYLRERYNQYFDKNVDRGYMKKIVLYIMYGNEDADVKQWERENYQRLLEWYESLFPSIFKLFELIKQNDYRQLAWLLQNIESKLVLDVICKRIKKEHPKMFIATIHDCLVTTEENSNFLKELMEEELKKHIGFSPKLKINQW